MGGDVDGCGDDVEGESEVDAKDGEEGEGVEDAFEDAENAEKDADGDVEGDVGDGGFRPQSKAAGKSAPSRELEKA